jgi:hypothetical protein
MLETYKKKYSNCKRIKFISQIPKKKVKDFLQHTDLCFDSVDSEIAKYGLSRNKWIDYMNAGRPIVCSYNGYQSMINEAGCGSFVEFGNIDLLSKEILRFKNMSKEERKLMGERARDYLKKNRLFSTLALQYQSFFNI